jgi:hypothetical protein
MTITSTIDTPTNANTTSIQDAFTAGAANGPQRRPLVLCADGDNRKLLATTTNELHDMPAAAIHGAIQPAAAMGSASKL